MGTLEEETKTASRAWRLTNLSCPVCCSFHVTAEECPGELKATGTECQGWRVNVETPNGMEAYGVLVAPSHELWRARVITFPNVLWMAPGGWGSLKFYGASAEEAEAHAIAFIERHCLLNGYLRRDGLEPVRVGGAGAVSTAARAYQVSPRKAVVLPLRFGKTRPATLAQSLNVSRDGLFVGTPLPIGRGENCHIALHVHGVSLPLEGVVMWNRPRVTPGRPMGMGVRLIDPPPAYTKYVRALP
jgi:Tfp pilus assembly protein PilZ